MAHSNLYKAFNTITPFSKLLAMACFIIFPFIGFYLGMEYQQMITPSFPPPSYMSEPPLNRPVPPDTSRPTISAPQVSPSQAQSLCTMEAKQCPDGSFVGRSGPNCEFVCPAAKTQPAM